MAYDAAFPHLFNPLAKQRVLVGVQIDVVGDRLVDEIAARTVLRGGQRVKRVDLFGTGAEADGFLGVAHNARTIACIIVYYKRRDGQHRDCATWLHKARELPKEDFRREVEKELTGREEEPSELIYFKVYKSQYESLRQQILRRDGWRCQLCGAMSNLEVHHREFRSHSGEVSEENLITLCSVCHAIMHDR